MATAIATTGDTFCTRANNPPQSMTPRPKRICFSFAAYANTLIEHLKASNIAVEEGLSDSEISLLESSLNLCFPPDLRSILQQGLPTSPGFPNWRSSSAQQLQLLRDLPVFSLLRRVSKNNFWHSSWGTRPRDRGTALDYARRFLEDVPALVPIYRHYYIASSPNLAGNPVLYVDHEGDVRLLCNDVSGFFRGAGFWTDNWEWDDPVWAATTPRRVEFWSDVAEMSRESWWSQAAVEVGDCLEGACCRLREAGWREEEIREMMKGGDDDHEVERRGPMEDREAVARHVRHLSRKLVRAGWSTEDVVYSLGGSF
ncbi:hypothetical protein QN277_028009 [Acacia crassicarpa]|uniref:Knr4/Smi1-like domain-containing protein n=1 Tax=Acacia crassicarpa TaxID=499986 RepID=A0AAE1J262_9FABA|nr:hypothetical protein QN277_028009 [Acacia crassicarpa]